MIEAKWRSFAGVLDWLGGECLIMAVQETETFSVYEIWFSISTAVMQMK